jgi:hypothetical protein
VVSRPFRGRWLVPPTHTTPRKKAPADFITMMSGGAAPSAARSLSSASQPSPKPARSPGPRSKQPAKQRPVKAQRGAAGANKKGGDAKQFSCHYCRQKRGDIVPCPKHVEGHRWCGSCVRNHLGLDIEKIRVDPTKYWPDGCAARRLFHV